MSAVWNGVLSRTERSGIRAHLRTTLRDVLAEELSGDQGRL
jgi:hypothetical protein